MTRQSPPSRGLLGPHPMYTRGTITPCSIHQIPSFLTTPTPGGHKVFSRGSHVGANKRFASLPPQKFFCPIATKYLPLLQIAKAGNDNMTNGEDFVLFTNQSEAKRTFGVEASCSRFKMRMWRRFAAETLTSVRTAKVVLASLEWGFLHSGWWNHGWFVVSDPSIQEARTRK